MSFRTAHAVDKPRMNFSGWSESAASAYAQRSTVRSTSVVSSSITKPAAFDGGKLTAGGFTATLPAKSVVMLELK